MTVNRCKGPNDMYWYANFAQRPRVYGTIYAPPCDRKRKPAPATCKVQTSKSKCEKGIDNFSLFLTVTWRLQLPWRYSNLDRLRVSIFSGQDTSVRLLPSSVESSSSSTIRGFQHWDAWTWTISVINCPPNTRGPQHPVQEVEKYSVFKLQHAMRHGWMLQLQACYIATPIASKTTNHKKADNFYQVRP